MTAVHYDRRASRVRVDVGIQSYQCEVTDGKGLVADIQDKMYPLPAS